MSTNYAVFPHDLVNLFESRMDRVSIYRILSSFTRTGILSKLIDSNGKVSYVFNKQVVEETAFVGCYFKCSCCNEVINLPELPSGYLNKLSGYHIQNLRILAEGLCVSCENKS